MNKLYQSIEDCNKAIELDEGYIKAYLRRAKSYMDKEEYESAVIDYEKVCKLDKTKGNFFSLFEHQALRDIFLINSRLYFKRTSTTTQRGQIRIEKE